jgi:hypothetical protein
MAYYHESARYQLFESEARYELHPMSICRINILTDDNCAGELWPCQNLEEMGPYGESSLIEDFYNVGLMFLELIIASYAEDANGALKLRRRYGKKYIVLPELLKSYDYATTILDI